MPSMATDTWWSTFLDAHGRDSEEEAAFLGFLTTQGVHPAGDPGDLQAAYGLFQAFMTESEGRESADPGPDVATLAAEQARVAVLQRTVPKSRIAMPGVDKPLTAATRPAETREPLTNAPPGPEGEAQTAPAGETTAEGGAPASESRYGRRRSESSDGSN